MSEIGDALRKLADECDGKPEVVGVVFAMYGECSLMATSMVELSDARVGVSTMLSAAVTAAEHEMWPRPEIHYQSVRLQ